VHSLKVTYSNCKVKNIRPGQPRPVILHRIRLMQIKGPSHTERHGCCRRSLAGSRCERSSVESIVVPQCRRAKYDSSLMPAHVGRCFGVTHFGLINLLRLVNPEISLCLHSARENRCCLTVCWRRPYSSATNYRHCVNRNNTALVLGKTKPATPFFIEINSGNP
jgi:hypothetical protein